MKSAFGILGYDKLIDNLAEQYLEHVKKMYSEIDFWESINNS